MENLSHRKFTDATRICPVEQVSLVGVDRQAKPRWLIVSQSATAERANRIFCACIDATVVLDTKGRAQDAALGIELNPFPTCVIDCNRVAVDFADHSRPLSK